MSIPAGTLAPSASFYEIGIAANQMYGIMVQLDSNRRPYSKKRRISYNYKGKTLQQVGVPWSEWSGVFEFDTPQDLAMLRALFVERTFLFRDKTLLGPASNVNVFWSGDFAPQYYETSMVSGYVPFTLIQASSWIST
jgi:hypothetical protein